MPSPFPMEPVDRHTAEVTIQISPEDNSIAAERIRMQVEVTIYTPVDDSVSDAAASDDEPTST
ncbi:MAG: ABC transporter permease, partial [Rhodopirellula sp. JB053]